MIDQTDTRLSRFANRFHARTSGLGAKATSFTNQPEPRTIGSFARGRQLCSGNFLFSGYLIEAPETSIWDLPMPDQTFNAEVQGFTWIDDLVAFGDPKALALAQTWTMDWIYRYGRGEGIGWQPDLTGRRLMRWINHAIHLLNGQTSDASAEFFQTLSRQANFLGRRWKSATPGLPRFEALTGLLYSGLSLSGMEKHIAPAMVALDRECRDQIDEQGGIPSRNPEELLEVFTLLNWAVAALVEAGHSAKPDHLAAIGRVAPTLRALRHSDGALARFHGGGRGAEGRLDQALATSGNREVRTDGLSMGYARLTHGRTSVVVDTSSPPILDHSGRGHASTLAFELTSGRRPLIVNCGSGQTFGQNWRRAGRATPSHSTLGLDGFSSSKLGSITAKGGVQHEVLVEVPKDVRHEINHTESAVEFVAGHDGYSDTHGLTHIRKLALANDGRAVVGEDTLAALDRVAEKRFQQVLHNTRQIGPSFQVRFHVHPDVRVELDLGGSAVSMALKSGEVWIFRHDGRAELSLEGSVYLEKGRLSPRATKQIVLSSVAMDYATRIGWTLSKAQDTPSSVRDIAFEETLAGM
jgi:uncharacterized heparinase superfamily protein